VYFIDKDQIIDVKEQLDGGHFSPTRQTEEFIINEIEDDSRAGMLLYFII